MDNNEDLGSRWGEARERMRPYIDALFFQDLGLSPSERNRYVDWILDKIIRPEYVRVLEDDWTIWQQDQSGDHLALQSGLTYKNAKSILQENRRLNPNSFYWYAPTRSGVGA
jgi:hypothetical protein